MPRRNRTFSVSDVLRIIDEHLTAIEAEEVRFTIKTGRLRSAMAKGLDPETPRLVEKIIKKLRFGLGRGGR